MSEKSPCRELMLSTTITTQSAGDLIMKIREINLYDDEQEKKLKEYKREPIVIMINCYGGCAYSTVAIVAAIETSLTQVNTACMGIAASGAFWAFLAGKERYAYVDASFMFHEVAHALWWEKLEGFKQEVAELERIQALYDNYVLKRTNILPNELKDYRTRKADWYMGADEAKKRGVFHHFMGLSD